MVEVERVWEEMRLKGVVYDVVVYNIMIGGFCSNLEVIKVKKFFEDMGFKGVECIFLIYDYFVRGYCKVKDVDSVMVVYREMESKSFVVEGLIIEVLVEGLCDGNKERVVEVVEIVKEAVRELEFCFSRKCYELLIKRLCEEGKMDRALSI